MRLPFRLGDHGRYAANTRKPKSNNQFQTLYVSAFPLPLRTSRKPLVFSRYLMRNSSKKAEYHLAHFWAIAPLFHLPLTSLIWTPVAANGTLASTLGGPKLRSDVVWLLQMLSPIAFRCCRPLTKSTPVIANNWLSFGLPIRVNKMLKIFAI